jgi:cell division protein ZapB
MTNNDNGNVQEQDLHALEIRVEELIRTCTHLKDENKTLRAREVQLTGERDQLLKNHATAHTRIEAMLDKLKNSGSKP